jgi:hypothetical protein
MNTMTYSSLNSLIHQIEGMSHSLTVSASTHFQRAANWIASSACRHLQRSATIQHRY